MKNSNIRVKYKNRKKTKTFEFKNKVGNIQIKSINKN